MKNVHLKTLRLHSFKGIKKLESNFSAQETNIEGRNGSGKTTVFDAFTFLLFGKDSHGSANFGIKTRENGIPLNHVDHTVEAVLEIDGTPVTLKKIFKENWVKKRGELEPELKGHETLCYIDDVPKKLNEYQSFISEILDEEVFKLITNPKYFASMPWRNQREILFTISGTISDSEIAKGKKDYEALLEKLSGKRMSDYLRQISEEKKRLKKDLDSIPTRVDEVERGKPDAEDFPALEMEIEKVEKETQEVDAIISNANSAYKKQTDDNQKIYSEINALKIKRSEIENKAKENNMSDYYARRAERSKIENDLKNAQRELTNHDNDLKSTVLVLSAKNEQIEALRKEFSDISDREYKEQQLQMICPVWNFACGDVKSLELHDKNQDKARETFNQKRVKDLEDNNEKGQRISAEIAQLKEEIAASENALLLTEQRIKNIQSELRNTPFPAEPGEVDMNSVQEWVDIHKEIKFLEDSVTEITTPDNSDLKDQKRVLLSQLEGLKSRLNKKTLIEKSEVRISELLEEQKKLAQLISTYEKDEFTINNFTKDRITEAEAIINSRFEIVKFKLFDTLVNGAEVETCEMTVHGVPYSDLNTASTINAGIDVINVLSQFYGVQAPIFIDNRESVTDILHSNSQIVNLIVNNNYETLTIK